MTQLTKPTRATVHTILWTLPAQAEPALIEALERIVWAQWIMAIVMLLCALAVVGAGVAVLLLARASMKKVEEAKDELLPHVTPVLSRASTIADDLRHITAGFRDDADDVHDTVRDALDRSRLAVDSLEDRIRRFGLVLEVVQEQAESLLMDAAATARGVHTTARALREEADVPPRARRKRRADTPTRREGT